MKWDRLLIPIEEPFTSNIPDQKIQLALSLFKLVRKEKPLFFLYED